MFRKRQIIGTMYIMMTVIVAGIIAACTPCVVREAQTVVAEADSLRAEDQMYDDSVQLAEACATLGRWQWFYADDYAHACYHYGRLLREKGDPVTAMQVLIRATHSRTHDYHILGRVYSNMGSICHLANDYSLSYDMYQRSADMFLSNEDSLNYYYALNDMAFELAEQGKKEETLLQIKEIELQCTDENVLAKTLETKAIACERCSQYDSAVYYTSLLFASGNNGPTVFIVRAQALSYLSQKDSAAYYAQKAIDHSTTLSDLNNALYILTNDDETKDKTSIRQSAADRADIQKLLEIRQGKLSQAVQLLEQDLQRKPNLTWLYAIIITIGAIGAVLAIYVHRKKRQHRLLTQQLADLNNENHAVMAQHKYIEKEYTEYKDSLMAQIEENCIIFSQSKDFLLTIQWKDFNAMRQIINVNFGMLVTKLQSIYQLSEKEIRLCVLTLFNCSYEQMSDLLYYASNGIGKYKDRIAKKMGTSAKNLRSYLIELAIGDHS